jgi:hypothetical protein
MRGAQVGRKITAERSPGVSNYKRSDLNTFLYADVGIELNGSNLTMLSVLARLGRDPWAEAARWTNLPKAASIASLAQSIGRMPLSPGALANADVTASRLITLLPVHTKSPRQGISAAVTRSAVPIWVPIAFLWIFLLMGLALTNAPAPVSPADSAAPTALTADPTTAIRSK